MLPKLKVRQAEVLGRQLNIYNIVLPVDYSANAEEVHITANAESAGELATYVDKLKRQLDGLVSTARKAEANLYG